MSGFLAKENNKRNYARSQIIIALKMRVAGF
jgi:hypothetical protein